MQEIFQTVGVPREATADANDGDVLPMTWNCCIDRSHFVGL
jgi:hypothetical protein